MSGVTFSRRRRPPAATNGPAGIDRHPCEIPGRCWGAARLRFTVPPCPLRQILGDETVRDLISTPLVEFFRLHVVAENVQADAPDSEAPGLIVELREASGPI